jgi:hypothetical protein
VIFHKYGDVDYVNRIWLEGQRYGVKLDPTKAEVKDASATSVAKYPLSGN